MKHLWTMSRDLELCVHHTMYVFEEFSMACAFSDGCPKGWRYSVKKKVVVTDSRMYMRICTIKSSCLQAISICSHQSTGLNGIRKRL